jgi:hypothetical protein
MYEIPISLSCFKAWIPVQSNSLFSFQWPIFFVIVSDIQVEEARSDSGIVSSANSLSADAGELVQ